jgi:hypothetical protein
VSPFDMEHDLKEFRKCCVRGCRVWVLRRHKKSKCAKHHIRAWRDNHPIARAFHNLKTHARERGISITLTIQEFKAFAEKTDYMKTKGKTSISMSVDRKENGLGYHAWNIQAITIRENSRKQWVGYFNGGVMPDSSRRQEYLQFERDYRTEIENISAQVQKKHAAGTPEFWENFHRIKNQLFKKL